MNQNSSNKNIADKILATIKAVSKNDDIKLEFSALENNFFSWNQNLVDDKRITLPPVISTKQSRAAADLAACYLMFHNSKIHQEFACEEQELFDSFEKIRVISNVKNTYRGIVKNILQKISDDTCSQILSGVNKLPLMLLQEVFEEENLLLENNDLSQNKINYYIKKLANNIADQKAFALEVESLLKFLKEQNKAQENENSGEKKQPKVKSSSKIEAENVSENQENIDSVKNDQTREEEKISEEKLEQDETKTLPQDSGEAISMSLQSTDSKIDESGVEFKKSYKVFTNKFDEIILPQKLVEKKELELLRFGLELRLAKLSTISKKLIIKLKKKLLAKRNSYIEQSQSDGILDRRKFTQLIIDPFLENCFVAQKQREYQDTVVSILLDNSGSMRGQPILMSALACEIIATILEKFAVKTEILGFTTVDWKGGKARKMWEAQGRAKNPGRLSDLRHIIYKSANQNFKKAKVNLGLMLKEGMLKENIDGEALLWAKGRLMQRDEKRKILAVISDGTPVDDSTNSTNDHELLTDHLHHVIHRIEKQTAIEIFGIGIGHQVGNFYQNSIAIKSPEELGDVMIEKITKLI